jgi:hypothetical protein
MRKIVIALLFSGSALFASPNSSTLQGEDAQFLFGNQKANVQLLSQNEMIETEGKWGWVGSLTSVAFHVITKVATGKAKEITFESVAVSAITGFVNPIGGIPVGNLGTTAIYEVTTDNIINFGATTLSASILANGMIEPQVNKLLK